MQTRSAIALAAAAALSIVVAAAVSLSSGAPAADPLAGKPVLPKAAARPDAIAKVTLERGTGTITLVRQAAAWTVAEKAGYPADPVKIRQLLLGLVQIVYVEPKTSLPELYARLNLDDPKKEKSQATLVELRDEQDGVLGSVIVGKRRIDELGGGNDGIYVRLPNETRAWLARGTLDLGGETVQWLDRRIADLDQKRVKSVVLRHADGSVLTLTRDKPEDKFTLAELPQGRKLKSAGALNEPASALQNFDLIDVKSAVDMAFPKDGIDGATFTSFEGLVVRIELAKVGEQEWIRLGADGDASDAVKSEAQDLVRRTQSWVYAIPPSTAAALRTKLADVMAPEEHADAGQGTGAQSKPKPAPATKTPAKAK